MKAMPAASTSREFVADGTVPTLKEVEQINNSKVARPGFDNIRKLNSGPTDLNNKI